MIVLGAFASLIVWTVWSVLYPYDILQVKPGSWTVQNVDKRVPRGDSAMLYVDYCADSSEPPRMEARLLQEGRLLPLRPHKFPAATKGCHAITLPLAIPRVLSIESTTAKGTGLAQLELTLHYRINPLREITYKFTSETFLIDP
jgi:hypothetical protein